MNRLLEKYGNYKNAYMNIINLANKIDDLLEIIDYQNFTRWVINGQNESEAKVYLKDLWDYLLENNEFVEVLNYHNINFKKMTEEELKNIIGDDETRKNLFILLAKGNYHNDFFEDLMKKKLNDCLELLEDLEITKEDIDGPVGYLSYEFDKVKKLLGKMYDINWTDFFKEEE